MRLTSAGWFYTDENNRDIPVRRVGDEFVRSDTNEVLRDITIRSEDVYIEQMKPESSHQFFRSAKDDANLVRRSQQLQRRVERTVREMVAPPPQVQTKRVSDEEFINIMSHPEEWDSINFVPVTRYGRRILKIRQLFNGEVGYIRGASEHDVTYLLLEGGYTGISVPVSKVLGSDILKLLPVPIVHSSTEQTCILLFHDRDASPVGLVFTDTSQLDSLDFSEVKATYYVELKDLALCNGHDIVLAGQRVTCTTCKKSVDLPIIGSPE